MELIFFYVLLFTTECSIEINICEILLADYCGFMIIMGFVFVDYYFKAQVPRFKCGGSKKKWNNTCFRSHTHTHIQKNIEIKSTEELTVSQSLSIYVDKKRICMTKYTCEFHKHRGIMESNENAVNE